MITPLQCTECGGHYGRDDSGVSTCGRCGHSVDVAHDIRPNLDEGEIIVYLEGKLSVFARDL